MSASKPGSRATAARAPSASAGRNGASRSRKRLFRGHVRRDRLTRILEASRAQAIVVAAPAGYGKTTLLREWLGARPNVAWYQASAGSADVAAFSGALCDALEPIVPGAGERLRQRLRVPGSPEKVAEPLAALLAEDLAEWPADARLVIDDYHLVARSAAADAFVQKLLALTPLRVVVAARRRPRWVTARSILYEDVTEITRDQLAMTAAEASELLAAHSTETVRDLVEQARGWPALLSLAAIASSAATPEDRVSEALFEYFAEEVLLDQPAETQRLMLVASVPTVVTRDFVRDTLDDSAEAELHRLAHDGILEEEDGELRFHPLLREFLLGKLAREDADLYADVADRTITAARDARRWEDAFELALRRPQLERAAEIVGEAAPELLAAGRVETVETWLDRCAPFGTRVPSAALARADLLIRRGRLSEARATALQVAATADDAATRSRAWHIAGRAASAASDFAAAFEHELEARRAASTDDEVTKALWGLLVNAAELERADARSYLDELAARSGGDLDDRLRIAFGRQLCGLHEGSFAGMRRLFDELLPLAPNATDPMATSAFLASAAGVAWADARYSEAERLAAEALDYCAELHLEFATGVCLYHRASAEIGNRKLTTAAATIGELGAFAAAHEDPYLNVARAILALKLDLARARATMRVGVDRADAERAPKSTVGELFALEAISAAAAHDADRALERVRAARSLTKSVRARFYADFAELLLAGARTSADELAPRAARLVEEAAAAEFLDAFVVASRAWPGLLDVVAETSAAPFAARARGADANGVRLLTPREAEILRLIAAGLSNAEIAERLFLSRNTVKVHVRHVLAKLGVATRLQAVLKAAELPDEVAVDRRVSPE